MLTLGMTSNLFIVYLPVFLQKTFQKESELKQPKTKDNIQNVKHVFMFTVW